MVGERNCKPKSWDRIPPLQLLHNKENVVFLSRRRFFRLIKERRNLFHLNAILLLYLETSFISFISRVSYLPTAPASTKQAQIFALSAFHVNRYSQFQLALFANIHLCKVYILSPFFVALLKEKFYKNNCRLHSSRH